MKPKLSSTLVVGQDGELKYKKTGQPVIGFFSLSKTELIEFYLVKNDFLQYVQPVVEGSRLNQTQKNGNG